MHQEICSPLPACRRFTVAVLCLFVAVNAHAGYRIKGYIKGYPAGKAYLLYEYAGKQYKDSSKIVQGNFSFRGTVPEPLYCNLALSDKNGKQTGFFLDNCSIVIQANYNQWEDIYITGCPEQEVFKAYVAVSKYITRQNSQFHHFVDSVYQVSGAMPGNKVKELVEKVKNKLHDSILQVKKTFFRQHPRSAVCAFLVYTQYILPHTLLPHAEQLFALLHPAAQISYYGKMVQSSLEINKRSALGAHPDFTMIDSTGNPFTLSSLKGKLVLVDFWASWCGPCRKENPSLVAHYRRYHPLGLEIVGVSLDSDRGPWIKAIQQDKLGWIQLCDLKGFEENTAAIQFGVKVIPTNFLLDKTGKIIAKDLQGEALTQQLNTLFNF